MDYAVVFSVFTCDHHDELSTICRPSKPPPPAFGSAFKISSMQPEWPKKRFSKRQPHHEHPTSRQRIHSFVLFEYFYILRVTCSKCGNHDCRLRERVRVNNMSLCVCGCTCVKQHRFVYHCKKSEPIAIKCTTRVSKKTLQKKSASVNVTNDKECI